MLIQIIVGFFAALLIAYAAYRAGSLSQSGALAALIEGTIIFGLGGWQWAVLLLGFFVSSSALTRLFAKKKAALDEKFDKGGKRDAGQVLANGGVASLFVVLHVFFPDAAWPWMGFAASLAAVNADTWATELGVLNPAPPRLITNGQTVERGTSGGISLYGTLSAAGGAAFIALLALLTSAASLGFFVIVTAAGLCGALVDSLLGATVQAIYRCPQCNKETEKHPLHKCGTPTLQMRGWKWLNNDLVNLACAATGAIIGAALLAAFL